MYGMTTAHPSNYTKGRSARVEFLVLHYTAGRNDSAAAGLKYFVLNSVNCGWQRR